MSRRTIWWIVTNKRGWIYRNQLWPERKIAAFWAKQSNDEDMSDVPAVVQKVRVEPTR
jgi:hypothetical protein